MRRNLLLLSCLAIVATVPALAHAQGQGDDDARRRAQADADRKKSEKEKQWNLPQAQLPQVRAVGPCPYVKVLYDAARYEEFKDGKQTPASVGFTGEITGVRANCSYKQDDPISVQVAIDFALGRGPVADGSSKDYRYWVAVTERNAQVIAKEDFAVRGEFENGADRVVVTDILEGIVIPRATNTTSGGNFEVLIGFDVTPEMAAFNRDGKRFRANATAVAAANAATSSSAPTAQ
ncbi:MAG: Tat pathway signal sequence domain protein [Caulobacterales bacterium 32-69-10]|nr:MAG: Tat pathway signal sequence domain protein [Caulobacterales bacterium 32-69-10]